MNIFYRFIPEKRIERIRKHGRAHSETAWKIGRDVLSVWNFIQGLKVKIHNEQIDDYMRACGLQPLGESEAYALLTTRKRDVEKFIANEANLNMLTVRDYAQVVEFYDENLADEDMCELMKHLPFSHFAYAKTLGAELAQSILVIDMEEAIRNGGKAKSVRWLKAQFPAVNQAQDAIEDFETMNNADEAIYYHELDDIAVEIEREYKPDQPGRELAPPVVVHMQRERQRVTDFFMRFTDRISASDEDREELRSKIDDLFATIERLLTAS